MHTDLLRLENNAKKSEHDHHDFDLRSESNLLSMRMSALRKSPRVAGSSWLSVMAASVRVWVMPPMCAGGWPKRHTGRALAVKY